MILQILIMSILSFILFLWIVRKMNYPYGGTDHAYHYKLSNLIRNNHHLPVANFEDIYQYFSVYPQLYHVICSFFPDDFLLKKANVVNYAIMLLVITVFGFIAYDILTDYYIDITAPLFLVYLLFILMPITYVVWNAKFTGLSPRSFGVLLGHLFLYACFYYLLCFEGEYSITYQIMFYVILIFIVIAMLTGSQFAFQFFLFTSIFLTIFTLHSEFMLLGILAVIFQFLTNFQLAKQFWIAQFHHKRNYFKYMSPTLQLTERPSIWRDFVYDFWTKRNKNYFLNNPLVEVFFGASLNITVLFFYLLFGDRYDIIQWNLFLLLASSFFAFFLTSLRFGRFLGEPQRYIEFGVPFACILSCMVFSLWLLSIFVFFNIIVILWYCKNSQHHRQLPEHIKIREELLEFMRTIYGEEYKNLLCNDTQIARYFYASNYRVYIPNYCSYYSNQDDFYAAFYNKNYHIIAPSFLLDNLKRARKGYIILYTNLLKFYDETKLLPHLDSIQLEHIQDIGKFKIFRFKDFHEAPQQ